MANHEDTGPLSPEAEIVRVRQHFHDLNEKVGVLAEAGANTERHVAVLTTDMCWMKDAQKDHRQALSDLATSSATQHRELSDALAPISTHVQLMQKLLYGAVAIILVAVLGAIVATVIQSGKASAAEQVQQP